MVKEKPEAPEVPNEPQEGEDISLTAWLGQDDSNVTGKVKVRGTDRRPHFLPIAALLDEEVDQLQKAATKPDPARGRGATKFDPTLFKRLVCVKGLYKASPEVREDEILVTLQKKLGGDVTVIAEAIIKLSGFDEGRLSELDKLVGFSG